MSYLPPLYDSNSYDKRDFFWKKQRRFLCYPCMETSQSVLTPSIQGVIVAKSTISDYSLHFPNFAYPLTYYLQIVLFNSFSIQLYDGNRIIQVSFYHERVLGYYYNLRVGVSMEEEFHIQDVIRISNYQIPAATAILDTTKFLQISSQSPDDCEPTAEYIVSGQGDIHDVQIMQCI